MLRRFTQEIVIFPILMTIKLQKYPTTKTLFGLKTDFFTIGFTILEYLKVMKRVRMFVPDPGTVYLNCYGCQRMHKVGGFIYFWTSTFSVKIIKLIKYGSLQ